MRNLSVDVPLRLGIMTNYGEQNEFCTMMLDFLAWPYELIVGDEMGMVNTKDPATDIVKQSNANNHEMRIDLTEELLNGKIDMICVPTIMSTMRLAAHDFVYPTSAAGREVYVFSTPTDVVQQYSFIGGPFTWQLWLAIIITIGLMIGAFSAMQLIASKLPPAIRTVGKSIMWWSKLSMGIGYDRLSIVKNYASINFATILWLILWGPVILQLYQANLKSFLTVSNLKLPFTDYDSLIPQLRSGSYRVLVRPGFTPYCPISYGTQEECVKLFDGILKEHPASKLDVIRNMNDIPGLFVTILSYPTFVTPDKISLFIVETPYKAKILAIPNNQISLPPASFPLRKYFPAQRRAQLDSTVIALQQALMTLGLFRGGPTMVPMRMNPIPVRRAFNFAQLASAFELLAIGHGLALCAFVVEFLYIKKKMNW